MYSTYPQSSWTKSSCIRVNLMNPGPLVRRKALYSLATPLLQFFFEVLEKDQLDKYVTRLLVGFPSKQPFEVARSSWRYLPIATWSQRDFDFYKTMYKLRIQSTDSIINHVVNEVIYVRCYVEFVALLLVLRS